MTERDIPDNWSKDQAGEPIGLGPNYIENNQTGDTAAIGSHSQSGKKINKQDGAGLAINNNSEGQPQGIAPTFNLNVLIQKLPRWTKNWVTWAVILTLIPGSMGFVALSILFKLPSAPNCPQIFWPLASASVRLHCAQLAASKQTINDLLQAITLVKQLPENHPLRGEINRLLEEWSRDILKLADESFQAGNLEEAIATSRKIPTDVKVSELVEEQIQKWQTIWSKAEGIYQEAEQELRQRHWQSAFMLTARLLRVNNKYWSSTKYDQLNNIIVTAREDGDKLYKAEDLAKNRNVDSLLKAIKLARTIKPDSYLYQKAQELISGFARKMLKLAQAQMKERNADKALEIARQIPPIPELQAEVDDFMVLGEAQRSAFLGTVAGLETAISQAQQIDASRDVYNEAQKLIARWQLEIEDVARLEKARNLASQGTVNDLTAAISEVQLIPGNNPRATEARQEIGRWRGQVETIEDRPYLDRAEQIAISEDVSSLQTAIAELNQVRSGRALYPEARKKIRLWTAKIERIQDQPYLDQAKALADSGNLTNAISEAQKIASSGRALSDEAQSSIDGWQEQIRAKDSWQKAKQVAVTGTPEALSEAIQLANRVSSRNSLRLDVNIAIDQWSQQLLEMARSQSEVDVAKAIDTAKLIPRGSSAYTDSREQIRTWRQFMIPKSPSSPSVESTPEQTPAVEGSQPSVDPN
ncbi:chromosome segregation ATPase [Dolichospermum sp. ST_sed1]|nr:chromosome segregation ATPase [Dolichospermum sp. ST_sed1]MDD1426190.1 chromosome segregation ATPase [Dolichospermum sp. ST_sed9]MDD1432911.1 chromosome segregation ATPase [Dolichospermum sp. ST_sed6]MDD1435125.1 chromosome segregation ATPase [Dolichospermum sp. ST_sed10]MDD1439863.1 chromosome segregation ATPase [Dolichospermum sp. ST_sed3]MDD1446361.1 chromosome segregation ATPase [Dolichospermum sp. ST_sed8]MDD1455183.1 chromosome segregation ATPase [Dolichospermum sp. ST_sed7]MDD14683